MSKFTWICRRCQVKATTPVPGLPKGWEQIWLADAEDEEGIEDVCPNCQTAEECADAVLKAAAANVRFDDDPRWSND